jgi:hypothetical protein
MFGHGASIAFVAGRRVVPEYKKLDIWRRRRRSSAAALRKKKVVTFKRLYVRVCLQD